MTDTAEQRLELELHQFNEPGIVAIPNGTDLFHWTATIEAPSNSPYLGGFFKVKIDFPIDYPRSKPSVRFDPPIYHPNVDRTTGIPFLSILNRWTESDMMSMVLRKLRDLLSHPDLEHPIEPEIAQLYIDDKKEFEKIAADWTLRTSQ